MRWLVVASLLVVLLVQCQGGTACSIQAASYDQSCTEASDCVAVFSGSFCGARRALARMLRLT